MTTESRCDVVVVGAGIAGCTAATLYGRRGARVALVERKPDVAAWKTVCTHFIQSSALPTIERLGVDTAIYDRGGRRTGGDMWTRWGWIRPPAPDPELPQHSVNVRRQVLDPLLREIAAATDGVELMTGLAVDGLVRDGGRIAGVEAAATDGTRRRIRARLVVAADGRDSRLAELAGVAARVRPHGRGGYFAYYRNVPLPSGDRAQMWLLDPDVAYAFPTDGGLTLLAAFVASERIPEWKRDIEGSFTAFLRSLPDAPPIDDGERVSKVIGKLEMPNRSRPAAAKGMAFAGDAALASDPLWGVGCGFAFQSAEWLVDATADAVLGRADLERALRRYRRRHRARLAGHDRLMCDYATGRPFSAGERLMFSAAARDERFAAHTEAFGTRNMPVRRFLSPAALARAAAINARHRRRSRGAPDGGPSLERVA